MIDATRPPKRPSVLLVRDMPEQRLTSMERLADEVERGFAQHDRFDMTATSLHASRRAARIGFGRADSYLARFVRYPMAVKRATADVYHIIDHGYGHTAALLPRERTVISCHDLMLLKADEGLAGFVPGRAQLARFRWSTSFLKRAARVVCPSEATQRDVVRLLGISPDRISVVPYGVDAGFRRLDDSLRAGLKAALPGSPAHAVLHVSTGDPYKNVPGTLRVLAALRGAGLDVVLVRAGTRLNRDQRRVAAELGVAGAVVDCGFVTGQRLVELYNAADVLLFPSFCEGYGWPPLEAMACGTPVVTSDAPSLIEVTGDAGLSAAAGDIAGLAAAVRAALEDASLAASLRRRGIERAGKFTWQRTIDGFADVYASVGERPQASTPDGWRTVCAA